MEFDLFLSYSSDDRDAVRPIAAHLRQRGVRVWFDEWECPPGTPFVEALERGVSLSRAAAVFVGRSAVGPWQRIEMSAALIEFVDKRRGVIPILLRGAPPHPKIPLFLRGFTWLDLRDVDVPSACDTLVAALALTRPAPSAPEPVALHKLIRATRHLTIWGHTLDKFTHDIGFRQILLELLGSGVKVTILQLNPLSRYAAAHLPYHSLESHSSSLEQHQQTLAFFASTFEAMSPDQRLNLEVGFANYMPRFRTVVADEVVYVYFYMYGADVGSVPDLTLRPAADPLEDDLRRRIVYSTERLARAAEVVPYIKCGQLFSYWTDTKLVAWDSWQPEERQRHRTTYDFYVTYAESFHARFGSLLEREVCAHLDELKGRTLVVGCGSGKEVHYIARRRQGASVVGIDFSPIAVELARIEAPHGSPSFLLGDFYDLDQMTLGEPRQFDSVVANASFVHLYKRDDIDQMLHMLWGRLNRDGRVFLRALYKERDGHAVAEELHQEDGDRRSWRSPRWFVYYSRAELAARARRIGFEVLDKPTSDIAAQQLHATGRQRKVILEKGFPHAEHREVFWPTLLLRKP